MICDRKSKLKGVELTIMEGFYRGHPQPKVKITISRDEFPLFSEYRGV